MRGRRGKGSVHGAGGNSRNRDRDDLVKHRPIAKAKKRRTEIEGDEAAIAKLDAEMLAPKKSAEKIVHHRDEVDSAQVMNIMGDEIEAIGEEVGVKIDRLNAREFFAWNLWIDLHHKHGVLARDLAVPMVKCADHKD